MYHIIVYFNEKLFYTKTFIRIIISITSSTVTYVYISFNFST